MVGAYWRRAGAHAWSRTIKALGYRSKGRIAATFLTAVAAAGILLFWGSQDAAGDMALARGGLWAIAIMVFPFLYVWHFVHAPAELDQQSTDNIKRLVDVTSKLTAQLIKKKTDRFKILTLSVFKENGQNLMSEKISAEEYSRWASDFERWKVVGLACLATDFSHQDAVSFRSVTYRPIPYGYRVGTDHNNKINALAARIQILNTVIDRFKDQWSPITAAERAIVNSRLAVFEAQIAEPAGIQNHGLKDGK